MYSTTNGAASYRMVPRAMLGTLKPAPFRQWVQLEHYAGKRDYVTVTTKDLAQVWDGITDRGARKALSGLEDAGWVVVDERTEKAHHSRIWMPWTPITGMDRDGFVAMMENLTAQRRDGARLEDERTRSFREQEMSRKGTAHPYVHVPVAVLDQAASPADFLVWVAMRSHFGPEGISTSAATIGKETGVTREGVARSTKRLASSGLLLPTGETGRKGTRVYTVPEHLAGTYRAGKSLPVPMAAAA
jgi:CRP-like cAMP-binding protein